jgi:hypothetical protein
MQKLLNKLGLYTKKQYLKEKHFNKLLTLRCSRLLEALQISEAVKAEAIEKNEKLLAELEALRLRLARSVKRRRK